MNARWKKILIVLLLLLLSIIPILYGLVYFFAKDIKAYVVQQVNKQLAVEVKVDDISFSVLAQFPKASVVFSKVIIYENYGKRKEELLYAEHIYLLFNIRDILRKDYKIRKLKIEQGHASLFTDKQGKNNYNILKEDSSNKGPADVNMQLEDIAISDFAFRMIDQENDLLIESKIFQSNLSGNFHNTHFELQCKGNIFFEKFQKAKNNYLKKRNIELETVLDINTQTGIYKFIKGDINVSGLGFKTSGQISRQKEAYLLDLDIQGEKMTIASFLALLPEESQQYMGDFRSNGRFFFNGQLHGLLSEKQSPAIQISFGIEDGEVYKNGIEHGLRKIECRGSFSNGSRHNLQSSSLHVEKLRAELSGQAFETQFRLDNLADPVLNMSLHGNIDLEKLSQLLALSFIEELKGYAFADISFNGRISDLKQAQTALNTRSGGELKLSNIYLRLKDVPHEYKIMQGLFTLQGNDFSVSNFNAVTDETNFTLNGTLRNLLPYLFLDKQELEVEANLSSSFIDLEKLLFPTQKSGDSLASGQLFPPDLRARLDIDIAQFRFYKFRAEQLKGKISLQNQVLQASELSFKAMNGQAEINGELDNSVKGKLFITCDANLKQIDINQLFYQCENFGQNELTDKHLKGKLDTKFQYASVWTTNFDCDLNKVMIEGDLKINNGELIDYKPMLAMSKFADVNELKHIRFESLENHISISRQTITIPQIDIRNNALDISMAGTHTFSNYLDYRVKVRLSDLLRKKRNKPIEEEFEEEDPKTGGLFIFLTMKGPIDNLKISYDKLSAKKKLQDDWKQEKKDVKEILKKEFISEEDKKLKEEEKKQEEEVNWEEDLPE